MYLQLDSSFLVQLSLGHLPHLCIQVPPADSYWRTLLEPIALVSNIVPHTEQP